MEQKFFIPPSRMALARALLLRTCRVDPLHPSGQVNSVYFDTVDLDQHERSESGERVKDKVRIRWYGDEHDPHQGTIDPQSSWADDEERVDAWLELKSRQGFASTKQRRHGRVPSVNLAWSALADGIAPPTVLLQTMAAFGFFPPGPIQPVIVISYQRHRFVEPRTGNRLSIDWRIRSTMLTRGRGIGERGLELPGAVVEVKCPEFGLPPSLVELAELGTSWSRFSKYSACLEAHEAERGSVSRLWPSGSMEHQPGALAGTVPKGRQYQPRGKRGVKPRS